MNLFHWIRRSLTNTTWLFREAILRKRLELWTENACNFHAASYSRVIVTDFYSVHAKFDKILF